MVSLNTLFAFLWSLIMRLCASLSFFIFSLIIYSLFLRLLQKTPLDKATAAILLLCFFLSWEKDATHFTPLLPGQRKCVSHFIFHFIFRVFPYGMKMKLTLREKKKNALKVNWQYAQVRPPNFELEPAQALISTGNMDLPPPRLVLIFDNICTFFLRIHIHTIQWIINTHALFSTSAHAKTFNASCQNLKQ